MATSILVTMRAIFFRRAAMRWRSRSLRPSQRVVYEGHPDLSFYQLNGYEVPSWSHDDRDADDQRRAMLELKIPGVAEVLDVEGLGVSPRELIDVAALIGRHDGSLGTPRHACQAKASGTRGAYAWNW